MSKFEINRITKELIRAILRFCSSILLPMSKSDSIQRGDFCGVWNFSKSVSVTSSLLERWEYSISQQILRRYVLWFSSYLQTSWQTLTSFYNWRYNNFHDFLWEFASVKNLSLILKKFDYFVKWFYLAESICLNFSQPHF